MNRYKAILIALGYTTEQQRNWVFELLATDGSFEHRLTMKDLKQLAHLTHQPSEDGVQPLTPQEVAMYRNAAQIKAEGVE